MINKNKLLVIIPFLVGIVVFLAVTILYFDPLWSGKVIKQHDIKTHLGMSKEIVDFRKSHNEEALWTNSMFGGMPAYQISVDNKKNIIRYVDSYLFRLRLTRPADYVFLYMVGFFILLLVLGVDPWLSIVGAIVYAFSTYYFIILGAGHNSKAHAIGYMAPTLAFVIYTFKSKKYLIGGSLFALFMALELYSNHPQITFYLGFIVLAYGISEFWNSYKNNDFLHFGKAAGTLVIALLLALAVNTGNYWTTMEYSPYTIRGKSELTFNKKDKSNGLDRSYATQWSYGKAETFTLLIPNANGGGSFALGNYAPKAVRKVPQEFQQYLKGMQSYWGNQPMTSGPVYVGAIVVFLFIWGLFLVKGSFKWAILGVTLLSIFLSWGHNLMWFTDLFFDYFPGYNKFRTVSMILVITQLTMALLAFLTLNKIIADPKKIKDKAFNIPSIYIALALTAGISLWFYIAPETFSTFMSDRDTNQLIQFQNQNPQQAQFIQELFDNLVAIRIDLFTSDALRSFSLIIFAAGLLFAYSKFKFNKLILIGGLAVLFLFDMIAIDARYLNDDNYERKSKAKVPFNVSQADMQILQDKSLDYRVFNTSVSPFNDASTSYFHKSIGGYHGAKLRRYQDVIEHHLSVGNMEVLNMLNTKYFIVGDQKSPPQAQQNPGAMGNVWFVQNKLMVSTPDQEIIHLGKAIEIKTIGDASNLSVYGREMLAIDTILITSNIGVKSIDNQEKTINLSRLPIQIGMTYIIGNNPKDTSPNFIDISSMPAGKLLAAKQFEVKIVNDFHAKQTAIINNKYKSYFANNDFKYSPIANIQLTKYLPNHLTYNSKADSPQLAVFSEIYYPKGWNAYLDDKKVEHIQADYILRAMVIPAGEHKVEFKFEPQSHFIGTKITFIASLLLLLVVIGAVVFEFKKTNKKVE